MPVSDSKREANKRYFAKSWTQIKLSMPNNEAEALRAYCADRGIAVAGFIRKLIRNAINVNSNKDELSTEESKNANNKITGE